jgi:hypothetical protein
LRKIIFCDSAQAGGPLFESQYVYNVLDYKILFGSTASIYDSNLLKFGQDLFEKIDISL